jgi:hypothetical protein
MEFIQFKHLVILGSSHYSDSYLSDTHNSDAHEYSAGPCIPDCIIISYLIATPNNYRIIARSGYWKYDHECRKTHQIKRVCRTCYAHEFNLNAFRHEWSYIQYSRRAIDYYIYFIDENKRYSRKFRWTMFSVFLRVNVYLATSLRTYVFDHTF